MHDSIFHHWLGLASTFMSGATFIGILAHAVNTFPLPNNKYAQWFLALIQYVVGQRDKSAQTTDTAKYRAMSQSFNQEKIAIAQYENRVGHVVEGEFVSSKDKDRDKEKGTEMYG